MNANSEAIQKVFKRNCSAKRTIDWIWSNQINSTDKRNRKRMLLL